MAAGPLARRYATETGALAPPRAVNATVRCLHLRCVLTSTSALRPGGVRGQGLVVPGRDL
eukprot:1180293-Prorocentrum_minimum.AAC.2